MARFDLGSVQGPAATVAVACRQCRLKHRHRYITQAMNMRRYFIFKFRAAKKETGEREAPRATKRRRRALS